MNYYRAKLALSYICICSLVPPAMAGQVQGLGHLQPSKFYQHPPEVQILDTAPTVVDMRNREQPDPIYKINIPPLATSPRPILNIDVPGSESGPGGSFTIDPSRPPKSGFGQSNIPAHSIAPSNLPNATSTNRLVNVAGQLTPPKVGQLIARKGSPDHIRPAAAPALADTYSPYSTTSGASASSGQKTETSVNGQIKRHSLLK